MQQDPPSSPGFGYAILSSSLAPLLVGHCLWQALQFRELRIATQKLGRAVPRREDRPLWLHMSSVGEVNAMRPLVSELRTILPDLPVIATTFTPTGAQTVARRFPDDIRHVYLPLDIRSAIRGFVSAIRPRCAVIMETEIWPQLFYRCRQEGIPLIIVNGRLSRKTLESPAWIRRILQRALLNVDRVFARSDADARSFVELGVARDRIRVLDNIKYAAPATVAEPIRLTRPYIVLSSSHDDEELQIARAWVASSLQNSHLLVIVPRHPKRSASILRQLQTVDANVAARSRGDIVDADTTLYLADTFGELPSFIAGSELVLTGGTLVARGGQNVIEAARLGKPVLFGPHMENFAEERRLLLERRAAIEVGDAQAMIGAVEELLADRVRMTEMSRQASAAIEEKQDVARRYIEVLMPYLDTAQAGPAETG